ncbi:hypothetical protein PRIPAC_82529 [Pristionchus pacificus]|nr:hypothetical protein PRIPAC_82529 [Pristionchus pacificus]
MFQDIPRETALFERILHNHEPAYLTTTALVPDNPVAAVGSQEKNDIQNTKGGKRRRLVAEAHCDARCRVCGDESTGHHYDIPSCNGCKSFFRRTLLEKRKYHCERKGNCQIKPKTRKEQKRHQCRACRFRLCVEAGMNPMGMVVQNDSDKEAALQVVLQQRGSIPIQNLWTDDEFANCFLANLMYAEHRHQSLRRSELNPAPSNPQTILDILQRSAALGLPHQEHVRLRIALPRLNTDGLPSSFKFWFYVDTVCAIEWAKTLNFFRGLDLDEQRELICCTAFQVVNVTLSYFSYAKSSDKLLFPDGKFSVWSPREADQDIIRPMIRLRIDETEYLLLKLLVICNPHFETISVRTRTILEGEREKLSKLLFRHCMHKHGAAFGASRFGEIVALESVTIKQAQKSKQLQSLLVALNLRSTRVVLLDEICGMNDFL